MYFSRFVISTSVDAFFSDGLTAKDSGSRNRRRIE